MEAKIKVRKRTLSLNLSCDTCDRFVGGTITIMITDRPRGMADPKGLGLEGVFKTFRMLFW